METTTQPAVSGVLYRNPPGAQHDLIVTACVWCGGPHRHILTDPDVDWVLRHPRCRPSRAYLVSVVEA